MQLKVSENSRFLVYEDGSPFFYLGDTARELFHRCTLAEAEVYLRDRAAKRFTVIQAVALAELDGLRTPNANGDLPLHDDDPMRLNEAYFAHVDAIVALAASLGLFIGMLPTWGDKWNRKMGAGPEIFTPDTARTYGLSLGRRYAAHPIIWILGGDRPVESDAHRDVLTSMAEGLREGDGGAHLITLHPPGGHGSQEYFPDTPWIDFHMWQSGHARNRDSDACIRSDYERMPVKPIMDAEPGYEDHPSAFNLDNGYLDDYDVRKSTYRALFAGAFGHTYGWHPIWQFAMPGREPLTFARRTWLEAMNLPGSGQVQHARALIESRPVLSRIPDDGMIVSENGTGSHHAQATRDSCGTYAFIYVPSSKPVEVDTASLSGATLAASWHDPRTGVAQTIGNVARTGKHRFTPPFLGPDWVLVLDDAACGYAAPGSERYQDRAAVA